MSWCTWSEIAAALAAQSPGASITPNAVDDNERIMPLSDEGSSDEDGDV